jgi:pimeloyl-ACP methyl ester carboxylesterase
MMQTVDAPILNQYWNWRGQSIHYVCQGDRHSSRPPLLLIHGFGASTDHWKKNIAELQADFQVWAIDLLGFGRSAKPDWEYSGTLWRDQLQAFIQEVIGAPAVLAGNSLGGYAALCVAADSPESVAGLVLLNSAGPFRTTPSTAIAPSPIQKMIGKFVRSLLLQPLPSFLLFQYTRRKSVIRKTLNKVYLDQSAVTDELVEDIYRPSCDAGAAKVFNSIFKSPRGEMVDDLLGRMSCPLLLLWGEGDPWMNVRERGAKFRASYQQVTEHYLQAGHCPHDEIPGQVNQFIREWMLALPPLSR